MKIISINSVNYGSTGNIMLQISEAARGQGFSAMTFSAPGNSMRKELPFHGFIGTRVGHHLHILLSKYTGYTGCFSIIDTAIFLRKLSELRPELIHLHNLHNSYINIPLLFHFIKKHQIHVVWTLHDCWAFTGHCPHFTLKKCKKWKTGCYECPSYQEYPKSILDNSKFMWRLKRKWFTGVKNMAIVTPSQWLADFVKQSYLMDYPVCVIHNGINLSVFRPIESDIRVKYGISKDKFVILGVSFGWGKSKGLDVFLELAKRLDNRSQIVLVGTSDDTVLPDNIISIHRTQDQEELARIYTTADVFVNPTREEVLGLVNIEALACGTPVITFNTGGSPECINEASGVVVECDDIDGLEKEIIRICDTHPFRHEDCIEQAKSFDQNSRYIEYLNLYKEVCAK